MTSPPPSPDLVSRRVHGDLGASSAELAIAMPAMLLLVLVSVQVGLWFHAHSVLLAAAQQGARDARVTGGTDSDGRVGAEQMLNELGTRVVADPAVTITRTASSVTVTVTGHSPAVVPGLTLDVNATVTSPLEQFDSR